MTEEQVDRPDHGPAEEGAEAASGQDERDQDAEPTLTAEQIEADEARDQAEG